MRCMLDLPTRTWLNRGHDVYKSIWTPFVGQVLVKERFIEECQEQQSVRLISRGCLLRDALIMRQYGMFMLFATRSATIVYLCIDCMRRELYSCVHSLVFIYRNLFFEEHSSTFRWYGGVHILFPVFGIICSVPLHIVNRLQSKDEEQALTKHAEVDSSGRCMMCRTCLMHGSFWERSSLERRQVKDVCGNKSYTCKCGCDGLYLPCGCLDTSAVRVVADTGIIQK